MSRGRVRGLRRSLAAASEVVGSMMLVAITVLTMVSLAFVIYNQEGPDDRTHADLALKLSAGAGGWGTGDELVVITHTGGEPLLNDFTTIRVLIGATLTEYAAGSLGSGFSDGKLTIGETWQITDTVSSSSDVAVDVIVEGSRSSLLFSAKSSPSVGGACTSDITPPYVSLWVQSPADVNGMTNGTVLVRATLTDACSGVDSLATPSFYYRINDGTGPAWTNGGAMTSLGLDRWEFTIPDLLWSTHGNEDLQYYVGGVTDTLGNTGSSVVRSDNIEPVLAITYVNNYTGGPGTITNFANLQAFDDANGTILEGLTSGTSVFLNADSILFNDGFNDAANGYASDDAYAWVGADGRTIRYGLQAPPPSGGTITAVNIHLEGHITNFGNDQWRVKACLTGLCNGGQTFTGSATDTIVSHNATTDRPGGGSWTWSDLANLEARINTQKSGGRDGNWQIDKVWAEIDTDGTTYQLDMVTDFAGVTAGSNYTLQMLYRVAGDTFDVQVYDSGVWTTRGAALTATTATLWTYQLQGAEYNAGAPSVRFLDHTNDGTQGSITMDYIRVVTQ